MSKLIMGSSPEAWELAKAMGVDPSLKDVSRVSLVIDAFKPVYLEVIQHIVVQDVPMDEVRREIEKFELRSLGKESKAL